MVKRKYLTEEERKEARNIQKRENEKLHGHFDQNKHHKKTDWIYSRDYHKKRRYASQKSWREKKRLAKLAENKSNNPAPIIPIPVPIQTVLPNANPNDHHPAAIPIVPMAPIPSSNPVLLRDPNILVYH